MKDDELGLWRRYRGGEHRAFEELQDYYRRWVGFWVNKVVTTSPKADRDELMQEGMIVLKKLIHKFDFDAGGEFISYAGLRMLKALHESLRRSRQLTEYQYDNFKKIERAQEALMRSLGRKPTLEEVAQKAGLTRKQVDKALDAMSVAFPEEFIASDTELPRSLITAENLDDVILVHELLPKLNERERLILTEYYYWGRTDLEISEQLNLAK